MDEEKRKFHLNQLPSDLIYINLKPDFSEKFFSTVLNVYGVEHFAEIAKVWPRTIEKWAKNCRSQESPPFVKLHAVVSLLESLSENPERGLSKEDLELNVQGLRGYRGSGILWDPKFPIRENRALVRFVVHLIGDGYLPKLQGTPRTPAYTNGNDFLRTQFHELLGEIFGDVSECSRSYEDRSGKSRSYIAFSKWIGYVIRHWYPDAKFDELSGRLPKAFFELPNALKAEVVCTFGDDDGHVGAHSIRFTSGGSTILEQMRRLILELMEATLTSEECEILAKSVGEVKPFRSWFILDVYRPLFSWYAEHIGFTHPERAKRLQFQLECDDVWKERKLDGFDLDFLTLIRLREVGSVGDVARRFLLREDFVFKVVQRLWKLGWIERVEKRKFTTVFQTTAVGEAFLARTLAGVWGEKDRVVVRSRWWGRLRVRLLNWFGTAAEVARVVGMPETTARGYLQGRRQWMHGKWVMGLAAAVGWGRDVVSEGVVVAVSEKLAPRYEQCDFLAKDLGVYRQFSEGEIAFDDWLGRRGVEGVREAQLLNAEFAKKLQSASAIRDRIIELARVQGGEITLVELKGDAVLQGLVANRYSAYLADRMAKLVKQGVFVRVRKGYYRVVDDGVR